MQDNFYVELCKLSRLRSQKTAKLHKFPYSSEKIWNIIYQISSDNPKHLFSYLSLINEYIDQYPDFKNQGCTEIIESFQILSQFIENGEFSHNLLKILDQLFVMSPFFNTDRLKILFDSSLKVCSYLFNQKKDLPTELIQSIDNIETPMLNKQQYETIFSLIKANIETEYYPGVVIFAPIASDLLDSLYPANSGDLLLKDWIQKGLQGSELHQLAACFLFERLSQHLFQSPNAIPSNFLSFILPHLVESGTEAKIGKNVESKEEVKEEVKEGVKEGNQEISTSPLLSYHYNKALRRLIECGFFDDESSLDKIISQASLYKPENISSLFKLLSLPLVDNESL